MHMSTVAEPSPLYRVLLTGGSQQGGRRMARAASTGLYSALAVDLQQQQGNSSIRTVVDNLLDRNSMAFVYPYAYVVDAVGTDKERYVRRALAVPTSRLDESVKVTPSASMHCGRRLIISDRRPPAHPQFVDQPPGRRLERAEHLSDGAKLQQRAHRRNTALGNSAGADDVVAREARLVRAVVGGRA